MPNFKTVHVFALAAMLAACTSSSPSSTLDGSPQMLCTQFRVKRVSCAGGGGDDCISSLDGGVYCADMAGAMPMADPGEVAACVASSPYWNVPFWNAFFACYLDGKTSMCADDYYNCQDAARKKVGTSDAVAAFSSACSLSSCNTYNADICFEGFLFNDYALKAGTACFKQPCDQIESCLATAHLN
jgi:hypothetical protein